MPMAKAPVRVAALMIPEMERKLKNFGTNTENKTSTTNNTATGAAMVEPGSQGLIFDSQDAEVLIKDGLPSRLPVDRDLIKQARPTGAQCTVNVRSQDLHPASDQSLS